ncbi:MAG: DNRLRE domain-containing protein [Planctomycetes bacterium]|nr:DNRLRE domain-containing protein [Planctomycetota bacterium]
MINFGRFLCQSLAFLFLMCIPIYATTYHVSLSGSDSNDGSDSAPWQSIQHSIDSGVLLPGDTVLIHEGEYFERVNITVSGSSEGFITFLGEDGAVIDGTGLNVPNGNSALIQIYDQSYIRIQNLEVCKYQDDVENNMPMGIYVQQTPGHTGGMSHIEILDTEVYEIKIFAPHLPKLQPKYNAHAIAIYGRHAENPITDIKIENCEIYENRLGNSEALVLNANVEGFEVLNNYLHHNDNIAIDVIGWEGNAGSGTNPKDRARKGVIRGNHIHNISCVVPDMQTDNHGPNWTYPVDDYSCDGIYVDGGYDVVIENNLVYNCDIGIEIASEHNGNDENGNQRSTSDCIIRNNIVAYNGQGGIVFGGYANDRGYTENCYFLNNTSYKNGSLGWAGGQITVNKSRNNFIANNIFVARDIEDVSDWDNMGDDGNPENEWGWDHGAVIGGDVADASNNIFQNNLYYTSRGPSAIRYKWRQNDKANPYEDGMDGLISRVDGSAIFGNPKFIQAGISEYAKDDFRILADSPAIDQAITNYNDQLGDIADILDIANVDYYGHNRLNGDQMDLGAHEYNQDNLVPMISGVPIAGVVSGQYYEFTPQAQDPDGGDISFAISNKPTWAVFNQNTGALNGFAGDPGVYSGIQITAIDEDGGGAAIGPFAIVVMEQDGTYLYSMAPSADTYVSLSQSTTNYGTRWNLKAKKGVFESYFRFPLNGINLNGLNVDSAVLRLKRDGGSMADAIVYSVLEDDWGENQMTWENSRSLTLADIGEGVDLPSNWAEIELTDYISAEMEGDDNAASLAIMKDASGTLAFYAKDDNPVSKSPVLSIKFSLSDSPVNNPPIISEGTSIQRVMSEDSMPIAFQLTLHAIDLDNDALNWSIQSQALHGIAAAYGSGESQVINYSPAVNYHDSDAFEVRVSDGRSSDVITVEVDIQAVNDEPQLLIPTLDQELVVSENFTLSLPPDMFGDPDGDTLTYTATLSDGSALPAWLIFNAQEISFTGNPLPGDEGSLELRLTAADDDNGLGYDTFLFNVVSTGSYIVSSPEDSGPGSLRQMIADVEEGGIITFASDITGINLMNEIEINKSLTLSDINGGRDVTISGGMKTRIFKIYQKDVLIEVNLKGLTLRDGYNTNKYGGAIYNREKMNLDACFFINNICEGQGSASYGGAIYHHGDVLKIADCIFDSNGAIHSSEAQRSYGGALYARSPVIARASIFTHNQVSSMISETTALDTVYGGAIALGHQGDLELIECRVEGNRAHMADKAMGGAISIGGGPVAVRISDTLIADNYAEGAKTIYGGAIFMNGRKNKVSSLIIENSTISTNRAESLGTSNARGGGLYLKKPSGDQTQVNCKLYNCTIANNQALSLADFKGDGGGIYAYRGSLNILSTIVDGNSCTDNDQGLNLFIHSNMSSAEMTYSLVGTPDGHAFISGENGNSVGVPAELSELSDQGGYTRIHMLSPLSPALDRGVNPLNLTTDQRGVGFPRLSGEGVDMGASEL